MMCGPGPVSTELTVMTCVVAEIYYCCVQSLDNTAVTEAARECIQLLSAYLGPNIFRARVESHNPR